MTITDKNTEIAIIGVGFSGLMTAIHLIRHASSPITLHLINDTYDFGRGPAYSTYSPKHVLNVPAAKMSCFPGQPEHFLDWAHRQSKYREQNKDILGRAFLPRQDFGKYLHDTWQEAVAAKRHDTIINIIEARASDIQKSFNKYRIQIDSGASISADYVIISTGNELPQNPQIENGSFYQSSNYCANPWRESAVRNIDQDKDILILGNALTMVDTIISIMDAGFTGKIHTVSPKGFAVLPHRFHHIPYTGLADELKPPYYLPQVFAQVSHHIRLLAALGINADPVIDSLRPFTQQIWTELSDGDKRRFLKYLMPRWNKLRHRMAGHTYDYIMKLQVQGRLSTNKGKLVNVTEDSSGILAVIQRKNEKDFVKIPVGRVINCTGPEQDISKSNNPLLRNLLNSGMIQPDLLKFGINTTDQWTIIDAQGAEDPHIYTLGGHLRGKLWESTAVPEIRVQAEKVANHILAKVQTPVSV